MHQDVLALECDPSENAPRLLIVSSGDEASTRAEGFSSTVVLDPKMDAGWAFATLGTPAAVALDGAGQVTSRPALGADAVFALVGARHSRPTRGSGGPSLAHNPDDELHVDVEASPEREVPRPRTMSRAERVDAG